MARRNTNLANNVLEFKRRETYHQYPLWPGACSSCYSESLHVLATFDDEFNIAMYDLWAQCSWCRRDYRLEVPFDTDRLSVV